MNTDWEWSDLGAALLVVLAVGVVILTVTAALSWATKGTGVVRPSQTDDLLYIDDVDAGVRCYGIRGEHGISCLKVRP